jgi:hypothetical protein
MSDNSYSIQELGGEELAQHYADAGMLPGSDSYNCIGRTVWRGEGFLSWVRSIKHVNSFTAMLSANADGLRLHVPMDKFAVFIPWTDATVLAERGSPATIVSVTTAAVPSLTLTLQMDDASADDLFLGIIPALARRDPPRTLFRWIDHMRVISVVLSTCVTAVLIGWLAGQLN